MALAIYAGYETLTFLHFVDAATGRTLTCEPGKAYDIFPEVPVDERFIPAIAVEMMTDDTATVEGEETSPEESGENV